MRLPLEASLFGQHIHPLVLSLCLGLRINGLMSSRPTLFAQYLYLTAGIFGLVSASDTAGQPAHTLSFCKVVHQFALILQHVLSRLWYISTWLLIGFG